MTSPLRPHSRDGFEIAIICALRLERDAVEALLEEEYEIDGFSYGKAAGDRNVYTTGRLGNQNVVLAYMPGMGTISAAVVATSIHSSFERIKVGIVVGICGGVPNYGGRTEILLGDVIISTSVIQIDFGRQYPDKFIRKKDVEDTLGRASPEIRAFAEKLSGYLVRKRLQERTSRYSGQICGMDGFSKSSYPGPEKDILYPADYRHKHRFKRGQQGSTQSSCICHNCKNPDEYVCESALQGSCEDLGCDDTLSMRRNRIQRAMGFAPDGNFLAAAELRMAQIPAIHFGRMASSNQVMKSGQHRDRIAANERVIGFEMESAGAWDYIPTIVIKSVCDYADSHKNKDWQDYAAATAAACTKAVLEEWRSIDRPLQSQVSPGIADTSRIVNPVHWTITRPANTLFTGREEILSELEVIIRNSVENSSRQDPCWIVISGMGGQGKSEICLQLARRIRQLFWGIFWVDVSTPSSAETSFLSIASRLHIPAQTWEGALQGLANSNEPWLLVLDNADNVDIDYQQYFPPGPLGVVLLTSRNAECRQYATSKWIDLGGLPAAEARELLLRAAQIPSDRHQMLEADAYAVASLLRSHPLALIQAGAYVSRGHCTLKDYPKMYQRQRRRLMTFRPSQARSRYGDVYATFEASAQILQSTDTEAASDALQLLGVLASLGSTRLPLLLFEAGWKGAQTVSSDDDDDEDLSRLTPWHVSHLPPLISADSYDWDSFRLIEAINLLKAFSLITTDASDGGMVSVSMHPLIHVWANDRLDATAQHESWVRAGCLVAISLQDSLLWPQHQWQLQPHVHALVSWETSRMFLSEPSIMIVRILMKCGWKMYRMRDDSQLFGLMNRLLAHLGLDRVTIKRQWLEIYDLTGWNLLNCGRVKEAVSLLEHVVKIREQTLAEDHPDRLASQHVLAMAYQANGQVKQAVLLLEHVVKIREQTLAEDHPDRLASQHELAIAYEANGQVKEAVSLLEHVVKIREQTLAEDHPSRLASQHELARAYEANGQVKEAVSLLEHVVMIKEQILAEDHPSRLASQHALAMAYQANGQVKEALLLLEQVVKIEEQTLAEDHPSRLASQHELARAYQANGQVKEAVLLLEQVVKIKEQTLAEDHPDRLVSQRVLARAYQANGQDKEAVSLLEQVMEI